MSKKIKNTIALICAVCLMSLLMCGFASAQDGSDSPKAAEENVQIYVDGLLTCRGHVIGGTTYVSAEAICSAVDPSATAAYTGEANKLLTLSVSGISITYTSGDKYLCANGRYLYLPQGGLDADGDTLFPVRELAKIFGIEVQWDGGKNAVALSTENMQIIESGKDFYNAADQELLAHIIHAEAGNQPMDGMIGVGNVVLNRVNSDRFPNSIYEVIYQAGQFDPVRSGSINLTPNANAVAAAYLVLEGYNTVGESLFFNNPGSSTGYLSNSRFVMRIQDHIFLS